MRKNVDTTRSSGPRREAGCGGVINSLQHDSLSCPRCVEAKVFVKKLNICIFKRDAPYPSISLSVPSPYYSIIKDCLTHHQSSIHVKYHADQESKGEIVSAKKLAKNLWS